MRTNCRKEDLVHSTIVDEIKQARTTILSSDNSETREDSRESDLVVADSEEDIVHASIASGIKQACPIGGGNGSSQVIRQSSRIKSKGASSHNMRTRNTKFREVEGISRNPMMESGSAEIKAANVIAIGLALGLDFQRWMRRCWKKLQEGKRKIWHVVKLYLVGLIIHLLRPVSIAKHSFNSITS
ncbi:hypothetical protein LWI29_002522 [Acer saccharum]|uniref:Uncharacterized protein n=1 Tax=Acer saccharum TaxID=4024 RepID=A0AA39RTV8_ACESA|nr:hypothetical protein LWI29_002522 [Acer saccharum]